MRKTDLRTDIIYLKVLNCVYTYWDPRSNQGHPKLGMKAPAPVPPYSLALSAELGRGYG